MIYLDFSVNLRFIDDLLSRIIDKYVKNYLFPLNKRVFRKLKRISFRPKKKKTNRN